ncbi:hypothetical protein QAD02_006745 [Eretmocerus hayati]|uniref:Uncharacterized protein n=1 Tax=Eretmocerus hayati TaxID=131215 RepID=A0ACC2N270_9HYME|nr:hypothetical protein QAD02_006745 [Eretmocerus hayati]
MVIKPIGKRLYVNGFVYVKNKHEATGTVHWECVRYRKRQAKQKCCGRIITTDPELGENVIIIRGLENSKHNHKPSLEDREEAEALLEESLSSKKLEKKSESETTERTINVCKSDSDSSESDQPSQFEMQEPRSLQPVEQTKVDDLVVRSKTNRQKRSRAGRVSYDYDSDGDIEDLGADSYSPSLIGHKLCIDGYIYVRNQTYSNGKIVWECVKYRNHGCPGRAITSDSLTKEKLIVYRGPKDSKHDHTPSEQKVKKAEQISKRRLKPTVVIPSPNTRSKRSRRSANGSHTDFEKPNEDNERIDSVKRVCLNRLDSQMNSANYRSISDPKNSPKSALPKLIGKQLCIDGYIYYTKKYCKTKTVWTCQRNQFTEENCPAIVITSNHLEGETLFVKQGLEKSRHNHLPSLAEVKDAEKFATSVPKKRKSERKTMVQNSNPALSLAKSHKSSFKRSLVDEIESEPADLGPERTQLFPPNEGRRRGSSLMSDPSTYRSFLRRFSKNPVFDTRNVFAALGSIYTSDYGRLRAFAKILDHRQKIENDLEILRSDPEVSIGALNYTSSFDVFGDETDDDTQCETDMTTAVSERVAVDLKNVPEKRISGGIKPSIKPITSSNCNENCNVETSNIKIMGRASGRALLNEECPVKETIIQELSERVFLTSSVNTSSQKNLFPTPCISIDDTSEDELEVESRTKESQLYRKNILDEEKKSESLSSHSVDRYSGNQVFSSPSISVIDSSEDETDAGLDIKRGLDSGKKINDEEVSEIVSSDRTTVSNSESPILPSSSIPSTDLSEGDIGVEQEIGNNAPFFPGKKKTISSIIPPVPAAIPIENVIISKKYKSSIDSINHQVSKIRRNIPLIDLTDDCSVKNEHLGNNQQQLRETVPVN